MLTAQPSTTKVVGYLPTWWYGNTAATNMHWKNYTHIIIFPGQGPWEPAPYTTGVDDGYCFEQYRDSCNAHGVKMIFSIAGGYGNTYIAGMVADLGNVTSYVNASISYASTKGFAGVELDWEYPVGSDEANFNRLLRMLREKLDLWSPKGTLAITMPYSIPAGNPAWGFNKDTVEKYCDFIMTMTYTLWMGNAGSPYYSGFDTPVNTPVGYGTYHGGSLSAGGNRLTANDVTIRTFTDDGYTKSKTVPGISFEGTVFGGVTGINQQYTTWAFSSTVTNSASGSYYSIPATGRVWDSQAKANYCYSGGYLYSFHDTNSVKAIVKFAQDSLYGGIMIYDAPCGYDTQIGTGTQLIDVLSRDALQGSSPAIAVRNQLYKRK